MNKKMVWSGIVLVVICLAGFVTAASAAGTNKQFHLFYPVVKVGQEISLVGLPKQIGVLTAQVRQGDPVKIDQAVGMFSGSFENGWVLGNKYVPKDDPYCNGTATDQNPVAVELAKYFKVTYQEIMDWRCKGFRWGQIATAYVLSAQTGKPVADVFALFEKGSGWREILIQLGIPLPVKGAPVIPLLPKPGRTCPTEVEKLAADSLAKTLDVPVADVLSWRCKGFGWGEIAMAYNISKQANVPVADVFAMRTAGKSWGEIMQNYGLIGNIDPTKPVRQLRKLLPAIPTLPVLPIRPGRNR